MLWMRGEGLVRRDSNLDPWRGRGRPVFGADRYRRRPGARLGALLPGSGIFAPGGGAVGFAAQAGQEFIQGGHAHLVELDELEPAPIGPAPEDLLEEHRGDQCQVKLVGHALGAFGQPVPAAEQAFDPPEKTFDLPAPPVNAGDCVPRSRCPAPDW